MSSAIKNACLVATAVTGLVCGFLGSKAYAGIPVEVTFTWTEPLEDVSGEPIDEALYYVLYANLGGGFFPVTRTEEREYTYVSNDAEPGCFIVYVVACFVSGDLCSSPSDEVEKCIEPTGDLSDYDDTEGDTLEDVGEVTNLVAPPLPPNFAVSVQNY